MNAPRLHNATRVFRIALLALTVAAACYVAFGFGRLWAEWRRGAAGPSDAGPAPAADLNAMPAVLPLAGQWSFGELDWNVRSSVVDEHAIAERFAELAAAPVDNANDLPDISPELLRLARNLRIQPTEHSGNQLYTFNQPDLRAQFVARQSGESQKAVSLAIAFAEPDGQWRLMEFTPRGAAGIAASDAAHLLPLPPAARRGGGRFDHDGRLLLEFVTLDSNAERLITMWKDAGWDVRPSGLGGPDDFSYLCARGKETVYAWSANPRASVRSLMLVRTPTSENSKN